LQSLPQQTRNNLSFLTNAEWLRCSRAAIYIFKYLTSLYPAR
jgi:hypothetical protein